MRFGYAANRVHAVDAPDVGQHPGKLAGIGKLNLVFENGHPIATGHGGRGHDVATRVGDDFGHIAEQQCAVECLDLEWADTGWWVLARDAGAGQLLLAWLEATCGEPSCPESGCHLVARAGPWRLPGRRAVLVAGASPDCIWVAGARRALGFGSCPRPELPLYQQAVTGGTALRDGGVAFLTPGALIRKGPAGEPLPGQGGFGWLADAVRP